MTIETNSPEETFALGQKLGEQAKAGQIYTLNGDLGVGKTVFTQGIARGLGITEASVARHLPLYRYMKREDFLFIISMYTVSEISKRWKKSVMMIILRKWCVYDRMGGTDRRTDSGKQYSCNN